MEQPKRTTYIIAAAAFVIIVLAVYFLFIFQKGQSKIKAQDQSAEIKDASQIEKNQRPYVTLTPISDGAEIIISIENMAFFDRLEYELTYLADNPQIAGDKITRGATGTDINTQDAKYKKSILLGTASRGVRSPDTGIDDGKLTMHMFKGDEEYQSETAWTLNHIGLSASTIGDKEGNFSMDVPSLGKDYWVIVTDTLGLPPNVADFDGSTTVLPVYGTFSIAPKFLATATLTIKLDGELLNPELFAYNHQDGTVEKLQSTYNASASTINADVLNFATYVVVSSQ